MSIFRVVKNKDFTIMSNYHLKDKKLSLKAKGLLSIMLSLPDDWDYTLRGLTALSKDSITSISSAIKELEDNGYLELTKARKPNGQFERYYDVFELPISLCRCGFSVTDKMTNKILYNQELYNQELNITNNNIKESIKEKDKISSYDWINDNEEVSN